MTERLPPQSESSEIAFLGACLYDPELAVEEGVAADLKAGDFFKRSHGLVWRAILYLYNAKEAVDVVTVSDVLAKSGKLDQDESPNMLVSSLSVGKGRASNARAYADTIKKKAIWRNLIAAAGNIAAIGYEDPADVEEGMDRAEAELRKIMSTVPTTSNQPDPEDILRRLEGPHRSGILTRFPTLNYITSGMGKGEIWVIGGFTSTGKSAVIVNLLEDVAKAGRSAMVASLEMTQEQYMLRALSVTSGISQHTLKNGGMTIEQGIQYQAARDFWSKAKVRIHHDLYSVQRIARKAELMKREIGLDVLFVDYLQNLSQTADEVNDIRVATIELQKLAKDLDCCVIGLSQISNAQARDMAENGGSQQVYTFKGTGTIAHTADVAIMLERNRAKAPEIMWFHIAKNRSGETPPPFAAHFDLATGALNQMSEQETWDANPNRGRSKPSTRTGTSGDTGDGD